MESIKSAIELDQADYEEILNFPARLIVVISPDDKLIKANRAATKILGWEQNEIIGRRVQELFHEADHHEISKQVKTLREGHEASIKLSVRCIQKCGSHRWISWTCIAKENKIFAMGSDINEEVQTKDALIQQTVLQKEYQTRFGTFFEQSILPMGIFSLEGNRLAVNGAWDDLFPSPKEVGEEYNILKDPRIKNSPLERYFQRAYAGESVEVPAFWYDPYSAESKGNARWLEAWISPVNNENGCIREMAIILKDVTDKIETEKALIQSISERKATEEKFQIISDRLSMAVKAGNIGIWEWIPGTGHLYWDETTENIYGYETGSFPRSTEAFTDCIHPEDRDKLWATVGQAMASKCSYRLDHRVIRKDGVHRWLQASGMALYDEQGNAYHMMGTVMDITDRKVAEADQKFLSQASELLSNSLDHEEILKTLCDHAISYFCDGAFVDQLLPDGSLRRLLVAYSDPEICRKIQKIDEDFPFRYENNPLMGPLITGKTLFIENSKLFRKQVRVSHGEEYYRALEAAGGKSSLRVRLKGRESVLGMITFFTMEDSHKEITKRHIWLSEELAYRGSLAYENALIHQASQEAIRSRDEFLSIASHELKTPLQSLTLQNQMRKRNLDKKIVAVFTPEKIGQMIEADLRHLMRITRLIDDMLDISRIRAGKLTFMMEEVEFCSFVGEVLERFRPQLDAVGCFLRVKLCEELVTHIDRYRTEQVLVNLLTNAMRYGAGKPIQVEVHKKLDRVQLKVIDQGPGIREEDIERIFERFERAISSNEVSGLGLGLYISRQIMEQNQGRLFVQSTSEKGSVFAMELPSEN